MSFFSEERAAMLQLHGVGQTVIQRLEQIGFSNLAQLAEADPEWITRQIALLMGSTCWQNSPLAQKAIQNIVALAQSQQNPS